MFKVLNKGFKQFGRMLDPRRFAAVLQKEIGAATKANAEYLEQQAKEMIDSAKVGPSNRPLTIMIKRRDHALLDTGRMRNAIRTNVVDWKSADVGVPRGSPAFGVAKIVSEGASLPVTDRMRSMFKVLWFVSEGKMSPADLRGRAAELWERAPGEWYPLSENTRLIRVPPRPFMQMTMKQDYVKARMRRRYLEGLASTWHKHVKMCKTE